MQAKIFMACFFWSIYGALIALQMNPALWWVGMSVGALVGYISLEFMSVIRAVSGAFKSVSVWRPNKFYWKAVISGFVGTIGAAQTACLALSMFVVAGVKWDAVKYEEWVAFLIVCMGASIISPLFLLPIALDPKDNGDGTYTPSCTYGQTNPVSVIFWWIPNGIWFVAKRTPRILMRCVPVSYDVARILKVILVAVFTEIHSDIRLLCGCDAAIGAMIGYFSGSAIIGGIVGGILGVLDYELVSKRLLHVEARQ